MKKNLLPALMLAMAGLLGWLWLTPVGQVSSPDITLPGLDGESLKLADFHGNPLLVTFWATTCQGCLREMPHLIELYRDFAPQGLQIIGIAMSYDPPNRVLAVRDQRKIPYPIALDIHADAARAFGDVSLTPTSFLIAPDGHILFEKAGELDLAQLRNTIISLLGQTATAQGCPQPHKEASTCSG